MDQSRTILSTLVLAAAIGACEEADEGVQVAVSGPAQGAMDSSPADVGEANESADVSASAPQIDGGRKSDFQETDVFPIAMLMETNAQVFLLQAFDVDGDGVASGDNEVRATFGLQRWGRSFVGVAPLPEGEVLLRTDSGQLVVAADSDADGELMRPEFQQFALAETINGSLVGGPTVGHDGWVYLAHEGPGGERRYVRQSLDPVEPLAEVLYESFGPASPGAEVWMAPTAQRLWVFDRVGKTIDFIGIDLVDHAVTTANWFGAAGVSGTNLPIATDGTTFVAMRGIEGPNYFAIAVLEDLNGNGFISSNGREDYDLITNGRESRIHASGLALSGGRAYFVWSSPAAPEGAVVHSLAIDGSESTPTPVVIVPESLVLGDPTAYAARIRSFATSATAHQ